MGVLNRLNRRIDRVLVSETFKFIGLSHPPNQSNHHTQSLSQAFYLSSGTCVVIGETARLGDDVTIMQGVTLGGNGKERGDRHPKLGQCVPLSGV